MKKLGLLASIPVLIGMAWWGTHEYFNSQVDNSLKQLMAEANSQSDISQVQFELVKTQKVDSGYQATLKVKSTQPFLQKIFEDKQGLFKDGLQFISHVQTGPVFFDEGMQFGQAKINTQLDLQALNMSTETLSKVNTSFANKPPLEIKTLLGLGGGGNYKAVVNPANFTDSTNENVQFEGLNLTGTLDKIGNHQLKVGKLAIANGSNQETINFAGLEGGFQTTGDKQGTFKGKAGSFQVDSPADQTHLLIPSMDIDYQMTGMLGNAALGTADIKMPKVSLKQPDLAKPLEADINLHSAQDVKEGNAQGSIKLMVDNLKGIEDRLNKFNLTIDIAGLSAAGLEDISKQSEQLQALQLQALQLQREEVLTEMADLTPPALPADAANPATLNDDSATDKPEDPQIVAKQQALMTKQQDLSKQLEMALNQLAQTFASKVLQSGKTKLDVTIDAENAKGNLNTALALTYAGQLPTAADFQGIAEKLQQLTPEEWTTIFQGKLLLTGDQAALPLEVQPMLQPYIQAGIIQQTGDKLKHEVGFGNGSFSFNGEKVAMQALLSKYMMANTGGTDTPNAELAPSESITAKPAKGKNKHSK